MRGNNIGGGELVSSNQQEVVEEEMCGRWRSRRWRPETRVEVPLPCCCQGGIWKAGRKHGGPALLGQGVVMWTGLGRISLSDYSGGLCQQEELGGEGGEKGDIVGFFTFTQKVKVILVLT